MRFFLDHDVPADIARVLRHEGHDMVELREVLDVEASDEEVFAYAQRQGIYMITCNREDFLALAASLQHPGLIVLFRRRSRQAECAHLLALLDHAGETGLMGNINLA